MSKILVSVITHEKYYGIFSQVWGAVKSICIPEGDTVEYIAVTDANECLTSEFLDVVYTNNIRLEVSSIDEEELAKYADSTYVEPTTRWRQAQVYKAVSARNLCRDIGINEGFDYWLNVDGDILPPKDALIKLRAESKDYIGGWAYCKKTGSILIFPNKLEYGEVYSSITLPMYCTLHSRRCFIDCPFELWEDRLNPTDDMRRMEDIKRKGYKMYVHPGVYCKHLFEDTGEPYVPR